MLGKSFRTNFLLGILLGVMSLFVSGRTLSSLSALTNDNFIPSRNIAGRVLTNPESNAVDAAGNILEGNDGLIIKEWIGVAAPARETDL